MHIRDVADAIRSSSIGHTCPLRHADRRPRRAAASTRGIHYIAGETSERRVAYARDARTRARRCCVTCRRRARAPGYADRSSWSTAWRPSSTRSGRACSAASSPCRSRPATPTSTRRSSSACSRACSAPTLATERKVFDRLRTYAARKRPRRHRSRASNGARCSWTRSPTSSVPGIAHRAAAGRHRVRPVLVRVDQRAQGRHPHASQPDDQHRRDRVRHRRAPGRREPVVDAADARHGTDRIPPDAAVRRRRSLADADGAVRAAARAVARQGERAPGERHVLAEFRLHALSASRTIRPRSRRSTCPPFASSSTAPSRSRRTCAANSSRRSRPRASRPT